MRTIREENVENVVRTSLEYFVKHGISNTNISSIAKDVNVSERTIFRYFPTKGALVLECALYLWQDTIKNKFHSFNYSCQRGCSGKACVTQILKEYARIFVKMNAELAFIQEAEVYLYRENLLDSFKNRPKLRFDSQNGPLSRAIMSEVESGNLVVSNKVLQNFYCNSFETLLGLLQKNATNAYEQELSNQIKLERLDELCEMLVSYLYEKNEKEQRDE